MQTLVIDFDCTFASSLGRVLERAGHQVHVASSALQALALICQRRFDLILIDSYGSPIVSREILEEIYTRGRSKVYVMTDTPPLGMAPAIRSEERIDVVPATAESILSIVHETRHSDVALVAGFRAGKDFALTLTEAGYSTAVALDLSHAVRLFFEGTYPVVLLEIGVPGLAEPDEFAIFHTLTARSLAVLAHDQPTSDLRCGLKPRRIAEVTQILRELQAESGKPDQAMSLRV